MFWREGRSPPTMWRAVRTTLCSALRLPAVLFPKPGGDAAGRDALHSAGVEWSEDAGAHSKLPQPSQEEEALMCLLQHCICERTIEFLGDVNTEELKAVYPLHRCLVDGDGVWVFSALSPEIHHQLLGLVDVEWDVVLLTPFSQATHLRSVGRLIVVSDQAYHRCVVSEFDDDVGAVCGCTVMCVYRETGVGWGHSPEEHQCWGSAEMKCCCPFWPPDFCLSESPGSSCTEICLVLESGASQQLWGLNVLTRTVIPVNFDLVAIFFRIPWGNKLINHTEWIFLKI